MVKITITICAAILMTVSVLAQAPNKMSYQAVIRNSSNALVTNSAIGMRISILQTSPNGMTVYVETQTPTTNANGLASIEIGEGIVVSGNFSNINWAIGPYFVKTETDPTGGTSYSITGTSQLLSVPYALYAKTVEIDNVQDGDTTYWKQNNNNIYFNQGSVGIGTNNPSSGVKFDLYGNQRLFVNNGTQSSLLIENASSTPAASRIMFKSDSLNAIFSKWSIVKDYWQNGLDNMLFEYVSTTGVVKIPFIIGGNSGNVGIGTISPQRTLHVNSVMRLEPIATAPSSPAKGDMYFDSTLNKLRVYDGTTWQNCW